LSQPRGQPQNLSEHNHNRNPSTRNRGPWELIYTEAFATRSEASRRERAVKKMKSHAWIEELARSPSEIRLLNLTFYRLSVSASRMLDL
jgi:predicted GIY-YIG superfamily endonuclease